MSEEKQQNTMKDLDQSMIDLGVRLCEIFQMGGIINDDQAKIVDAVTKLYSVVKANEQQVSKPPEKANTTKSK